MRIRWIRHIKVIRSDKTHENMWSNVMISKLVDEAAVKNGIEKKFSGNN